MGNGDYDDDNKEDDNDSVDGQIDGAQKQFMIMMTMTKMMLLIVLIFRLTEPRSSW